ncbi:Starch-binding associating with outer membrane [Cnuella takakiae]|uniref:Starch-binding associating with outer membrane n=1 Tax=Cnuella takakiae TaxID=1302690 RepID=A0A1M4UR67_9BACT|nr:RagB/SusD family nutrient uptake outer membrane protein [Cnuella takakiae]OLY92799.1 RagB/SusD family nutrient uptake outer membrane protein [Cnuella takakiae]SHE59103.1 Starch-binding associating with outer membrane [Cnuella takakiae]
MKLFQKISFRIACLLAVLSLASCQKYLDLKPQDGIIRQNFWQTKEQMQAAVNGCYASLLGAPAGVSDRALPEYLFLWGELRADMLSANLGVTNEDLEIMNSNIDPSNTITNWRSVYRTINYCNTVIDFAPSVLEVDKTLSQASLDAAVAEAKTLRALMFFYLVRSFRDVPLVLKATYSDQQLEQLPKSSDTAVLAQIVKDLVAAEPVTPESFGDKSLDKGRITKYTVNALLADVYLWMEKYPEALAAADKVINSGRFGLVRGNSAWFNTLYYQGNSNEAIFEFQYDRQKLNPFFGIFRNRPRFMASSRVMEEIYTVDFQDDTKRDIRGDGAAVRATDGMIWKYLGVDNNTMRAQEESFAHWIVYRYADVLLMKAECLAQLNRGREALDIVYTIRQRAGALAATDRNPDAQDKVGITDFILEERAREFAYEGKRWYDVLRHAKRDNYSRLQLLLDLIANSVPADRQQSAIAKAKDKNSHYFPIYIYELQTDKNLVQNPFYK